MSPSLEYDAVALAEVPGSDRLFCGSDLMPRGAPERDGIVSERSERAPRMRIHGAARARSGGSVGWRVRVLGAAVGARRAARGASGRARRGWVASSWARSATPESTRDRLMGCARFAPTAIDRRAVVQEQRQIKAASGDRHLAK